MVVARAACQTRSGCDLIEALSHSRMEVALAEDPAGAFRTMVRVKAAAAQAEAGPNTPAPGAPPRSLMEALKQAGTKPAVAVPQTAPESRNTEPASTRPSARPAPSPDDSSRQARELIDAEPPRRSRSSRPGTARVGRLATAKLRQLQRLKEAAASLESLARGEIEEATVEIIRHDSSRPDGRGRYSHLPSKR